MKKMFLITTVMLFAIAGQSQEWTPLFNGKDLKGWHQLGGKASYKVKNGVIIGTSKEGTPNSFLATDKEYDDFILEFEFKIDSGFNSGVQLRSHSKPDYRNGSVYGYQFEIDPSNRRWTGGIYDESRRNWLYPLTKNPSAQSAYRKNGEWNKARVEAIGNSICTWVNGMPCANLWDDLDRSGFIALQVHSVANKSDNGKTVMWRNIQICTKDVNDYLSSMVAPEVNVIPNTLSPTELIDGWVLLFDGKTSNGWRSAKSGNFPTKGWAVEDGILKVLKSNGGESTNGGDVITTRKYKNFILSVEFKITKGANSGIKYFVDPDLNKGAGSAIGCEFQILDDAVHPDAKMGVKGNRKLASLYDLIPAPEDKPFNINEFNTAVIVVGGDRVEHYLNGTKMFEYDRNCPMWNALVSYSKYKDWNNFGNNPEGHILLQDHGDEVWFRNIKLKEL